MAGHTARTQNRFTKKLKEVGRFGGVGVVDDDDIMDLKETKYDSRNWSLQNVQIQ